jgi:hypothetical protein
MYGRHYPIYNKVTNCLYKSNKSYGNKDVGEVEILVGSSKSSSHHFLNHAVKRVVIDEFTYFRFYLDSKLIKEAKFENNKQGKPETLIYNKIII